MNALIRKNNKELLRRLRDLGYLDWSSDEEDIGLAAGSFNFKFQNYSLSDNIELCVVGLSDLDDFEDFVSHGYIDCGENEDLFLAIAALREDSDYMQWFTDGETWFCNLIRDDSKELHKYWLKATSEELIEHFNSERT